MNQQASLLQALALLIKHLGYKIDGGKELYFPDTEVEILNLTPEAQIQFDRHPTKPGFIVRYLPNKTIPAKVDVEIVPTPNS